MKITFVLPFFGLQGGVRVVAIYARLLAERGHDVLLVAQPPPKRGMKEYLREIFAPRTAFPRKTEGAYANDAFTMKVLDTQRPVTDQDLPDADIVIATWWETAFWVDALSPAKGRKLYFVQHHEVHRHLPWQISRGSYFLPMKKMAVSQWLVDIMALDYGDRNVALLPNAVDPAQFHATLRSRQPVPTVGFMYTDLPYKGVSIILRAIETVQRSIPELRVLAFGARPIVPDLPLPPGSEFHCNPDQAFIRQIYADCDLWLFGSYDEGFGLPLLEAMACRTPLIATRAGAAPDLVVDGQNGYVVEPGDHVAMAERIAEVLLAPTAVWEAMSAAAQKTADDHSWQHATDRLEQLLADLAAS